MSSAATPYPWRSIKAFLLGLTFFAVGGFLLGVGLVIQTLGSSTGDPVIVLGIGMMIVGFFIAMARLG